MSNMKNQHDEYQYPGEEHVESSVQEPVMEEVHSDEVKVEQHGGLLGFVSRKRKALFLVVIVIAAFVGFKFMTSNNNNVAAAPVEKPVVVAPPVEQPSPQVESQIGRLAQVVSQNQQNLSQLQDQVDNMQTALSRANDSYQTMNNSLKAMTLQLQKVQEQLAPKPKVLTHVKKVVPIVYYIKAIVPGRAWVLGSNGTAQSVSVGDNLPQYGRVSAINADSGVVMTSSGKVIEYGSGDF